MDKKFDIVKMDCEERFGIAAAGGTAAGKFSSLVFGTVLTAVFYGILSILKLFFSGSTAVLMFFPGGAANRSIIPVLTVFLAIWALAMLLIKRRKLAVQQAALKALPAERDPELAAQLLQEKFDPLAEFAAPAILNGRISLEQRGLPPLEVAEWLEKRLEDLERDSDISFMPVSCFIWAVPVLGFIGTVLGLSQAVGNFGSLANAGDTMTFSEVLPQVTGGLATAFETTLIALVLALVLQIISSFQQQAEARWIAAVKQAVMPSENSL